jgi:hypothetical protein
MSSVIPGLPNPLKLLEVSDPSNVANTGFVYTNDVSGRTELMYKDDTGVEVQLTNAGGLGKLFEGSIVMKEKAAAIADTAAYGQLWIKTATPNELYFTTDAGNDIQLTTGTGTAGGGGGISSIVTKTGNYTAVAGTDDVILCNAATLTITLPASSGNTGQTFYIKNIHATGVATIDANGSETIDGALAKYITTQYESLTIVCDGSNWHII